MTLDAESASVHKHLDIMQSVISRMARNSASCKTWCITIVSAILVLAIDKDKPQFLVTALLPVLLFCLLDTMYLSLEFGFRQSYEAFARRLHDGELTASELFIVKPSNTPKTPWKWAITSWSIYPFYGALIALIFIAQSVV